MYHLVKVDRVSTKSVTNRDAGTLRPGASPALQGNMPENLLKASNRRPYPDLGLGNQPHFARQR